MDKGKVKSFSLSSRAEKTEGADSSYLKPHGASFAQYLSTSRGDEKEWPTVTTQSTKVRSLIQKLQVG